ncbi:hypothetical protein [Nonomuraea rhodomycinica]|uniref:Uncharacterized protein n=1 Tax=Nonomuraea rhodomycinica TaxID=1712872 RepID=A0A7Y6IYX4_9ACTN|nr:hypothetical protein [Nonomuraea rhodomycinica]NUW46992.1 hypothetical protein [Nonomuraea rhodomycinica]
MALTADERELAETLRAWAALSPPLPGDRYGSLYALLLDLGEWFAPEALPVDVERGPAGFCYANAAEVATARGWTYVEGLALVDTGSTRLPVPHAWACPGPAGTAAEVTWPPGRGVAYLGVPLAADTWSARPFWDSSPVLDVHARRELLRDGVPRCWHAKAAELP